MENPVSRPVRIRTNGWEKASSRQERLLLKWLLQKALVFQTCKLTQRPSASSTHVLPLQGRDASRASQQPAGVAVQRLRQGPAPLGRTPSAPRSRSGTRPARPGSTRHPLPRRCGRTTRPCSSARSRRHSCTRGPTVVELSVRGSEAGTATGHGANVQSRRMPYYRRSVAAAYP